MADPFIGQITMFAGTFAPMGWAFCDGQMLQISQYDVLFALIGTTYGGNGQTNFALPDLRGRLPIHQGNGYVLGAKGGAEKATVATNELPSHTHRVAATTAVGTQSSPEKAFWAAAENMNSAHYSAGDTNEGMRPELVGPAGGSSSHENMMPYLVINFIIALGGIFPQRP